MRFVLHSARDMNDITTPRLRLEPLRERHADDLFAGLQDERIYDFVPSTPPTDNESLRNKFRRLESRKSADGSEDWLNWAVRCSSTGEYIGYVQSTIPPNAPASVAFIFFPAYWGRGYAHEAVTAMLEFLAASFAIRNFHASVDTGNRRSIALLERLGFERVAMHTSALPIKGVLRDEIEYRKSR